MQTGQVDGAYGRNVDGQAATYGRDKLGFFGEDLFVICGFADEIFGDGSTAVRGVVRIALRLRIGEVQGEFPS